MGVSPAFGSGGFFPRVVSASRTDDVARASGCEAICSPDLFVPLILRISPRCS
jgi:hypothetical protein